MSDENKKVIIPENTPNLQEESKNTGYDIQVPRETIQKKAD